MYLYKDKQFENVLFGIYISLLLGTGCPQRAEEKEQQLIANKEQRTQQPCTQS